VYHTILGETHSDDLVAKETRRPRYLGNQGRGWSRRRADEDDVSIATRFTIPDDGNGAVPVTSDADVFGPDTRQERMTGLDPGHDTTAERTIPVGIGKV
jgi:hypothetical protein